MTCGSPIRPGQVYPPSTACRFRCVRARKSPSSVRRAPARARSFICCCASTIRSAGTIALDGVRLPDLDPSELRRRIALVPQDSVMFAASVRDNIRFGRPDASDAEVGARCRSRPCRWLHRCAAARVSIRRPASAASHCRAASASASPSRARSCATRRCLLLDEATSSLDAESETQVAAALADLMRSAPRS